LCPAHLNQVLNFTKFTVEKKVDGCLAMLNILSIRKEERILDFSVYRKPTHTGQYIAFDSNHPLQHELGVVCTLEYRARTINNTKYRLNKEVKQITQALLISDCRD